MDLELLVATKNEGKVKELQKLLEGFPVSLHSLNEFEEIPEPEENGATFAENAIFKAQYYAREAGLPALADDSGLEVEALGGKPGIFSARYAGESADDEERNAKLLAELSEVGEEKRQAQFVCVIVFCDANSSIQKVAEGICCGKIASFPRGTAGFGYDPIFIPEGYSETFGELSGEIKHKISHRGRAMEKIIGFLVNL